MNLCHLSNLVKRTTQTSGSSSQTEAVDPEKTLETLKENFQKVQKKMAREAVTDIERMERYGMSWS